MTIPRDMLMAFIDGELSPSDAAFVEAECASHPERLAYIEYQKALKARLALDFAPSLALPIPPALAQAVRETPMGAFKGDAGGLFARLLRAWNGFDSRTRLSFIPAGAMAGGLVLGIYLAGSFGIGGDIAGRDGSLFAQGELAHILTGTLSAEGNGSTPIRIGISFLNRDGRFCRSFVAARRGNALAGIACRDGADWRIATLAATRAAPPGLFQKAGSDMPASIRSGLVDMMAGDPLDAAGERAARAQDWRAR